MVFMLLLVHTDSSPCKLHEKKNVMSDPYHIVDRSSIVVFSWDFFFLFSQSCRNVTYHLIECFIWPIFHVIEIVFWLTNCLVWGELMEAHGSIFLCSFLKKKKKKMSVHIRVMFSAYKGRPDVLCLHMCGPSDADVLWH